MIPGPPTCECDPDFAYNMDPFNHDNPDCEFHGYGTEWYIGHWLERQKMWEKV